MYYLHTKVNANYTAPNSSFPPVQAFNNVMQLRAQLQREHTHNKFVQLLSVVPFYDSIIISRKPVL